MRTITLTLNDSLYKWYSMQTEHDRLSTAILMEEALEQYMLEVEALVRLYKEGCNVDGHLE